MTDYVFDASAPLAVIRDEAGSEVVLQALEGGRAFIATPNVMEVVSILTDRGMSFTEAVDALTELELTIVPFEESTAMLAASIRTATRPLGLGLGDRACLALGMELSLPVLTGDRAWARADVPVQLTFFRP